MSAQIIKVFKPFTLSSVMIVRLDSHSRELQADVILKLFDRRFASQLRKDQGIPDWTPDIEQQYRDFVLNGNASDFIARLNSDEDVVEKEGDDWNAAQNEAYLHDYMQSLYETETEVYRRIRDLQGKDVPSFVACTSLNFSNTSHDFLDCPGILLENIEGSQLSNLGSEVRQDAWQYICEDAIRIVNDIGDRNIRNEDVRPRNFLVRWDETEVKYKAVMIDFAMCEFRGQEQDLEDWSKRKAWQDEEGAIGYVMQKILKGGFVYRRSNKYVELDTRFKAE